MTVAQGIRKSTSIGLQVALGTPNVTAGQILRRRTHIGQAMRDMFESDEIVSHHQSTGSSYGLKKVSTKLDALLSALTYQLPIEGLLEAVFVAGVTLTASDIAMASATSLTGVAAAFLSTGFKAGDVVIISGFTGAGVTANNGRHILLTSVVAGALGMRALDGTTLIADAAGEAVTITVVGKKCKPPLTGNTNSYYTIEDWYSDVLKSELFADCKVATIALGLPPTGNGTIAIDFVGLSRTNASGAQQVTTRTAETTTPVMSAINGYVYVQGALAGNMTAASIQITNGAAAMGAVIGSNNSPDVQTGRIKVTGSFSGLFDSTTFQDFYDGETNISLVLVLTGDQTPTANFMAFTLGRVKITGDAPDDGEKAITRTYPFTAEINTAGGPALAWDKTIITVQDSSAA